MSEHAKDLEPKIRRLQELSRRASETHAEALWQIIHRPGWTTLREVELVHVTLDSAVSQLEGLEQTLRALIAVAEKIG
jgi:hypothetical protein